jgi:hypothetical protein
MFWNTIKETVNFLSSTNAGTSGSEGKRDGDVWRAIKGDGYHQIWYAWYSEFKIVNPSNKGIIERRSVHSVRATALFTTQNLLHSRQAAERWGSLHVKPSRR